MRRVAEIQVDHGVRARPTASNICKLFEFNFKKTGELKYRAGGRLGSLNTRS
jgi:hypothetical protein